MARRGRLARLRRLFRSARWRTGALLAVAVALSVAWEFHQEATEYVLEHLWTQGSLSRQENPVPLSARFLVGEKGSSDRVVTVLVGSRGPQDVHTNTCTNRLVTAALIEELRALGAAVIAVDKFYGPNGCLPLDAPANTALQRAVGDDPDRTRTTVVVGLPSTADETEPDCIAPGTGLRFGEHTLVRTSLLELDQESLRIPLAWRIKQGTSCPKEIAGKIAGNSFAYIAATSLKPPDERLEKVLQSGQNPVGRFEDVPSVEDVDVLCRDDASRTRAARAGLMISCPADLREVPDVKGRVVVIGDKVSSDRPPFLDGDRYGAEVQSRYIDALLRGAYLTEWSSVQQMVFWIVVLILVALAGALLERDRASKFSYALAAWVAIGLVSAIGLLHSNVYPPVELLLAGFVLLGSNVVVEVLSDRGGAFREATRRKPHAHIP